MNSGDTIVAAATPLGFSGVAVIRISGPLAFDIAEKITRRNKTVARMVSLVNIYEKEGEKLDESLITFFTAPSSYTGENTVEISSHGNPAIVDAIIATICSHGARIAEPGEFTYRSFVNGKIDLIQAEAIASLIKSKSIEGAKEQQKILGGQLSKNINKIRQSLIDTISSFEHQLDISEDDVAPEFEKEAKKTLTCLHEDIQKILNTFSMGKMLNFGVNIVLTGPPNVGKSSLLNYICGEERAIVNPTPGTTRDTVSVELILEGVPLRFFDTAGIRDAPGPVEKEGVSRAIAHKESADLLISVSDTPQLELEGKTEQPHIFVLNKADLHDYTPPEPVIHISSKNKTGLNPLMLEIKKKLGLLPLSSEVSLLSTPRQQVAVGVCKEHLVRALALFTGSKPELEILSLEIRGGIEALDTLLGKTTPDDIINNIFKSLCVGK